MILFGSKQERCSLADWEHYQMILFGTKQEQTFLKMGKRSSNVPNVFECSPLIGHCGYWESWQIFITFFYILSFTVYIQRLPTEIMNSGVFLEIFISLKWVFFLPGSWLVIACSLRVCQYGTSFSGSNVHIWAQNGSSVTAWQLFEFIHFPMNLHGVSNECNLN